MSTLNYLKNSAVRLGICSLLLLPLLCPLAISDPPPQTLLVYKKNGANANDSLGYSVAGLGDVNGDGPTDFIVGVPGADPSGLTDAGSAIVYSGANGSLLYQKNGGVAGEYFGAAVGGAGDVNGDGKPDFIVGAWGVNVVYVYSGANGNLIYQIAGGAGASRLGFSVAGAGDVNGDGKADFIAGEPGFYPSYGKARVFSGATGLELYVKNGSILGGQFGWSVAGAGDVNGDGKGDFIVGAPFGGAQGCAHSAVGTAYIYSGATGDTLYTKTGACWGDRTEFGFSVAGAGDINADGKADFIVGARRQPDPGRTTTDVGAAFVYSGVNGALLYEKYGLVNRVLFGSSVGGGGDVDGDGKPDFIVGASGYPGSGAGYVRVYSGLNGALLSSLNGDTDADFFGWSVSNGGDMDQDGRAEFIVGAYGTDTTGTVNRGTAYVYQRVPGGPLRVGTPRPTTFNLDQNYPNPFNANTNISFSLDAPSRVELVVYNILGEKVRTLVNEERPAGAHEVAFDGRDDKGKSLSSGTYFYKLNAGDKVVTKQMVLVK